MKPKGAAMEIIQPVHNNSLLNLLIVEDQPMMNVFYRKALSPAQDKCFNLHFCSNVESAIQWLDVHEVHGTGCHFALLDHSLPDGKALDILEHATEQRYDFRSMVITGHNDTKTIKAYAETMRVDAFLAKPVSIRQLQVSMHKHACPLSQHFRADQMCFDPYYYVREKAARRVA